jgi:circadian clock protein KaiC
MRLVKYRGTSHGADEYPFLIDEYGLSVLPVTALGFDAPAGTDRVSTGIDDLDALFGGPGGVFAGSGVLISGGSGTGKSTLCAHFAAAACERGERVLAFAFEESPQQIIRNMKSIGLDLSRHVDAGRLVYESRRPARHALEAHLVRMQRLVERVEPSLVVVDPVSALLHVGVASDTRAALVRLADHLKARGITAVFTALGDADDPNGATAHVSSIMDTWISLQSLESAGERNRGIYVLKSRGMAHSNQIHELLMSERGVELLAPAPGAIGLTGTARIAHIAKRRAEHLVRDRDIQTPRKALERKRRALQSQIETLQAEFAAEEETLRGLEAQAQLLADEDARLHETLTSHVKPHKTNL